MMDRRAFLAGTLGLLAAPLAAEAQSTGKVPAFVRRDARRTPS
jgi:hypothetical protein